MTRQKRELADIMRGGYCVRWHSNPDMAHIRETLAEHHARVAQILLALHPASSLQLIDAALHHDAGEPAVGDVPWPVKRDNPSLAYILDITEQTERMRLGCNVLLDDEETRWLKMADRLAGVMHVQQTNPALLKLNGWPEDIAALEAMATALGCIDAVAELIGVDPIF